MNFLIADTFTASLARLTGDEQKVAKTTAFDLQLNPASPGMRFHKLERARDKNFWSVRVSSDLRLIVHRTVESLLLCFIGHHDKAYEWAERRRLETHPATGAAQIVEVRETVKEIVVPNYVTVDVPKPPAAKTAPLAGWNDEELLRHGVPADWLERVKSADEDELLAVAEHLPAEAAEAVLQLATGGEPATGLPVVAIPTVACVSPAAVFVRAGAIAAAVTSRAATPPPAAFQHPDAQRRFRVITNVEELSRALEFPWEKWSVFLHPEQRDLVVRANNGPARVAGSAGTGKTVVALHRAVHLARANPDARVLLATFSDTLASALHTKMRCLIVGEPRLAERIDVCSLDAVAGRLHKALIGPVNLADRETVRVAMKQAAGASGSHRFSLTFLLAEWDHIVDAWQLASWPEYRDVARLGRKTRLSEAQRRLLWSIFEEVRATLGRQHLSTTAGMYTAVAAAVKANRNPPFDFAIVDEAQDLSVPQLRLLAAIGGDRPNALFFAGDLGQRIFQQPFSWKSLGVDVRGRSRTLRVNYRTSHQIRQYADRLLDAEVTDADGNAEDRSRTVSVFNGPLPQIATYPTIAEETAAVARWLSERAGEGVALHELGVFVRTAAEVERAEAAVRAAGLEQRRLDASVQTASGRVAVGIMHLAKGLEYRAVVVMACDDEVLPLQERIEAVGEEGDLQEVYETERQLLYVACTRARDHLLVTGVEPASEFLDDLRAG